MEQITTKYNAKYPLEIQSNVQDNTLEDEDGLIYEWSILKRGIPTPTKSDGNSLKNLHKRVNDLQVLQQDMYMKKELVHKEKSPIQMIEVIIIYIPHQTLM